MKMSDALRGAAETAPVDSVHVSVGAVRTRSRRNRALRTGANGVVGVGAAALVFAGVMGVVANQTGLPAAGGIGRWQDRCRRRRRNQSKLWRCPGFWGARGREHMRRHL